MQSFTQTSFKCCNPENTHLLCKGKSISLKADLQFDRFGFEHESTAVANSK